MPLLELTRYYLWTTSGAYKSMSYTVGVYPIVTESMRAHMDGMPYVWRAYIDLQLP